MTLIVELTGYAKSNADAAKTLGRADNMGCSL